MVSRQSLPKPFVRKTKPLMNEGLFYFVPNLSNSIGLKIFSQFLKISLDNLH
jgi:hypothetical protein